MVCVGPQADTHASSSAAYRQPSTTVGDSGLVASQAVGGTDGSETTTNTAGSCGGIHAEAPKAKRALGLRCVLSDSVAIESHVRFSGGDVRRTRSRTGVKAPSPNRNAMSMCAEVSDLLCDLQHADRLYRLKVIADGRCSVAAVLLALRLLQNEHVDSKSRLTIDAHRRQLGQSMLDTWTEEGWVDII